MTETDRRNYRIAVLLSLILHGSLLLAYLPGFFSPKPVTVDMLPVGMVEIASGSGKAGGELQAAGDAATKQISQPVNNATQKTAKTETSKNVAVKKPDNKSTSTKNVQTKKADPDKENSLATTKGEKQTTQETKDSGGTPVSSPGTGGENGGAGKGDGAGNGSGSGVGIGLGSGEGKVSRMGAAPPYPKNAMNEGKEGEVWVRILVLADGSLEHVNLQKSSGDERLDRAAVTNVERNWKFAPESKNYYIDLIFVFSIQNGVSIKFLNSQTRP